MNIFYDQFTTGQVVAATGVQNPTLQSWMKRGFVVGQRDKGEVTGGGKPGFHRRFSFFNVMEIATAKALIDCGMSDLKSVFQAAVRYSHVGEFASSLDEENEPARDPGIPFDTSTTPCSTLLCANSDQSAVVCWIPGIDPLPSIRQHLGGAIGFTVIHMNPLFDRVVSALGYHPETIFELAYPPESKCQ